MQDKTAIDQKDLIKFLVIRVLDQDKNNFEEAFHQLNLKSQSIFFKTMAEEGKLRESIQYLPADIKHIAINFGGNPIPEIIGNITCKLENFAKLEKVDFDISNISSYTHTAQECCDALIKPANCFARANAGWYGISDDLVKDGLSYPLNYRAAVVHEVINDSICLLKAKEKIKIITIHFMGAPVNGLKTHREEIHKNKDNQLFHMPNFSTSALFCDYSPPPRVCYANDGR